MSVVVVQPGPRTTIQDLGRPGYAALGVCPSGAADRTGLRLANRLLGNAETCAALECTMGGLVLQSDSAHWCVVTGAVADVTVDGHAVGMGAPFPVGPGSVVDIGPPRTGLRSYAAFAGGLDTRVLLGSRAEDTLGRLVPTPVTAGAVLPIGIPTAWLPRADHPVGSALPGAGPLVLPVTAGPRRDWIDEMSWVAFTSATFAVTDRLDRIGVRVRGPALTRRVTDELPSEGLIRGAVQLPPSGEPIVFLADHPTTGGYPVIAVVDDPATDLLAQARPGQAVRFARPPGAGT